MERIHQVEGDRERLLLDLDEIARQGARRMLAEALEAEVSEYIEAARGQRDERGHALVVRNGHANGREVLLGAGSVAVQAPRVNDRRVDEDGNRKRFNSVILPPYMRRSPKVSEVLPLLYLHGLSSGDFVPALEEFFGSEAGLSASTITRLTEQWQQEREHFMRRDLSQRDYVYVWVDGIHTGVRLGSDGRLCCLVILGARLDGTKELVALADGYRESEESWAELLRDLNKRGMRAPELAVGDGALGFWSALRDVFPQTRCQRDWVHKTKNVLDSMPKSVHGRAKRAIKEITEAENKKEAVKAIEAFTSEFSAKWPKAVAKITQRQGSPARLLRLPGRTLAPSSYDQPDRVGILSGEGSYRHHQGTGLPAGGVGDDLQANGSRRGEVAQAHRRSSGGTGQSESEVQKRGAGGRKRGEGTPRDFGGESTTLDDTSA